jgi:demethylmenaquinone methyltransferase/2-methoxy-6-polyprenyl-1,4-benzoquinol methylase
VSSEAGRNQKQLVRNLFRRIAADYDRVNRIISLGQDQRWRKAALSMAHVPPGGRVLDVATGTGDMALLARDQPGEPYVVGADLTIAMLQEAARKVVGRGIPLVGSDGLALAFSDGAFDVVTSAFMMRNVPDVKAALLEQYRVVRPGGRVVCLEITWPQRFPMAQLFGLYFFGLPPILGQLLAGAREPYRYLPRSVRHFMEPSALARIMEEVGLRDVSWVSMMLGTVAVHTGVKPA